MLNYSEAIENLASMYAVMQRCEPFDKARFRGACEAIGFVYDVAEDDVALDARTARALDGVDL